jgi:hypothetical protein
LERISGTGASNSSKIYIEKERETPAFKEMSERKIVKNKIELINKLKKRLK